MVIYIATPHVPPHVPQLRHTVNATSAAWELRRYEHTPLNDISLLPRDGLDLHDMLSYPSQPLYYPHLVSYWGKRASRLLMAWDYMPRHIFSHKAGATRWIWWLFTTLLLMNTIGEHLPLASYWAGAIYMHSSLIRDASRAHLLYTDYERYLSTPLAISLTPTPRLHSDLSTIISLKHSYDSLRHRCWRFKSAARWSNTLGWQFTHAAPFSLRSTISLILFRNTWPMTPQYSRPPRAPDLYAPYRHSIRLM